MTKNIWAPPGATVEVRHRHGGTYAAVVVREGAGPFRRVVSDHTVALSVAVTVNGQPIDLHKPTHDASPEPEES